MSNKLLVIVGPTSSGKTEISIKLALRLSSGQTKKKFSARGGGPVLSWNGIEVVSADSRQVYKGMDIGTGKITKKEMKGIPHYLLNIASPKRKFTVAQYQKLALKAINKIHQKEKIPFLVGGSGFYIQAVIDGILIPKVKPDWKLRKELEKKSAEKLFKMLKKSDPKRARSIDKNNRRRLIRALEIVIKTKKPILSLRKKAPPFDVLIIGIKKPSQELKKLINQRILKRLRDGMIAEIKRLKNPSTGKGLSWKRLEEFGLEYRYVAQYLQEKISYEEMIEKIQKESERYAKRQMTWFKKNKRIKWIKNYKEAEKLAKNFLLC